MGSTPRTSESRSPTLSFCRQARSSAKTATEVLTAAHREFPGFERLSVAKLAAREPKRVASLCPTVLLKIAGHGAPDEPAAVIAVLDRNEASRIKVDSALRMRGHRRRRAL